MKQVFTLCVLHPAIIYSLLSFQFTAWKQTKWDLGCQRSFSSFTPSRLETRKIIFLLLFSLPLRREFMFWWKIYDRDFKETFDECWPCCLLLHKFSLIDFLHRPVASDRRPAIELIEPQNRIKFGRVLIIWPIRPICVKFSIAIIISKH